MVDWYFYRIKTMEEIKINETHICYLIKEGDLILSKTKYLRFKFESELKELKRMSENENRNRYELEEYIKSGGLINLTNKFNYCHFLSGSYQELNKYEFIDINLFKVRLEKYKSQIRNRINEKEDLNLEEEVRKYHKTEMDNVVSEINKRKIPYLLNEVYDEFNKDKNILAFSHRKVGFTFPEFKLGKDFDVIFKTNFGYGGSSYFYTNIRYKNIDILPYSDWVKYRIANQHEIIRYTRKHRLKNESWIGTMTFTSDVYNNSITNSETFIEKWIINECSEMVDGLEEILNKDKHYEIVRNYFDQENKTTLIGIELIDFKGEKISGALSFLEKIKELRVLNNSIDIFIKRILSCNISIYPILNKEISQLITEIKKIEIDIATCKPNWEKLKNGNNNYHQLRLSISKKITEKKLEISNHEINEMTKIEFNRTYPEYENFLKEFIRVDTIYKALKDTLSNKRTWEDRFKGYCQVIEKHFKNSNISLANQNVA